jgi:class 3 adenylate cyclase/tetratricopeptide (TPR) repeat protein
MTTPREKPSGSRRLAAIWFADIVGFTRLAAENEPLALRLVEVLQAAATAAVESHEGNIVKFTGDGVLAEFASTEHAAFGAIQLLLRFGQLTESWPQGPHEIRLGMHLGDVAVGADGDIYGDGVNRAARLEGLAEPGKLLVSEDVYRQLRSRPVFVLTDSGTRTVKGYDEPLRVYDAEPTPELARSLLREAATPEAASTTAQPPRFVRPVAVGITFGILTFVALGVWTALGPGSQADPEGPLDAGGVPASENALGSGTGPNSDVVDPAVASAATVASDVEGTSPNGSGVGSTPTGDRETDALDPRAAAPEPGADVLVQRGRRELESGTRAGIARATEIFTRAIELAPDHAPAHLGLAGAQMKLGTTGARPLADVLPEVREHLDEALRLDPGLAEAHAALATFLATFEWDWEGAESEFATALALGPNPGIHRAFAQLLSARGRHEDALTQVAMALRLEPGTAANVGARGMALFRARNYTEARPVLDEALRLDPTDGPVRVNLARTLEALGQTQEARLTLQRADGANGSLLLQVWRARQRAGGGRDRARGDQRAATLRAGLDPGSARNPDAPYYLAALQLSLGEPVAALRALQQAVRTPSPSLIWLPTDPMWDAARSSPQFQRIVERIEAGQRTP